jgi:L-ascorbate metabolism protein UlaG (beta-lactamase superfamily)
VHDSKSALFRIDATKSLSVQPSYRNPRVRKWLAQLWSEGIRGNWRTPVPAPIKPIPATWKDDELTASWLGHATVLLNFFGVTILTDPVLFPRIGLRIPFLCTIGPKRLTAPALTIKELPKIDLILLSHAHFDHTDLRTLNRFDERTQVITAARTSDLLRSTHLRNITELDWGESRTLETSAGRITVTALRIKHWGARLHFDNYRGYNAYLLERDGRRVLFSGDTAMTGDFAVAQRFGPIDLAIMSIGCYNPWIATHCTPEEAVQMAETVAARFVLPMHHQTFRLSFEPFAEPIERFERALRESPERIALREIGETFVLPR